MKKGKFIAVANMKGGVGKTTTVVSLAEFLARNESISVLVIDLDQQASASLCIIGPSLLENLIVNGRTIDAFLALKLIQQKETDLLKRVRRNNCTVTNNGNPVYINLLPAGPNLRLVEREMLYSLSKKKFDMEMIDKKLSDFFIAEFAPLRQHFDVIIFDCAPGISPFTEIAIKSSDMIIIPTIPDRMSAFGLKGFCEIIAQHRTSNETQSLPRLLFTRVQPNVRQHREVESDLRQSQDVDPFNTTIPQCAALAEGIFVYDAEGDSSTSNFVPTIVGKYGRPMVTALTKLADEVWRAL